MTYDMSAFSGANDTAQLFAGLNEASGGLLVQFLYPVIFLILLLALMKYNPTQEAVFAAAMPGAIMSLVFWYYDMSSIVWMVGHVIIIAGAGISMYANRGG